jgi:2'-5' RNA ligase
MSDLRCVSVLIGIQVPPPLASIIDEWRAKWHPYGLKTITPHITLVPPVKIEYQRVYLLEEITRPLSLGRKINIQINGFGLFDRKNCVLFVDVERDPALTHLHDVLIARARAVFGFEPQPREFHPHITLANRLSHDQCLRIMTEQLPRNFQDRFKVDDAVVWVKGMEDIYQLAASIRLDK